MVLRLEALRERLAKLEQVVSLAIDRKEVYAALQRSVRDFTDFETEILAWLDRRAG